jgi:TPR repeat protein
MFWYRKAAAQEHAKAQFKLGLRYDNGQNVPQDYKQALSWYRKAADLGHARAQFNLGLMYGYGHGAAAELVEAHKWLTLAISNGMGKATTHKYIVEAKMSAAQMATAQAFARDYLEKRREETQRS